MTRKRVGTSIDAAVVDVWKRELGSLSTRTFVRRFAAAEDLVLRLDILLKLEKHRGCVNTVSFNAEGGVLVSGSDDRRVILWDWETGRANLSFHSGHHNNVFQAKIMPYTADRSIVTCGADGQVRHAQILERGEVATKLLGRHQGRAHKLCTEPGSPHNFYTCGEDGMVQHIDLRTGIGAELFTCGPIQRKSFVSIIQLNAIAMDPRNPNLFAVGGSDQFARLFDIRKCKVGGSTGTTGIGQPVDFFIPHHLVDKHVGITGVAFSEQSELLVSYSDEFIYLFSKDMGLGPDLPSTSQVSNCTNSEDRDSSDMDSSRKASPEAYKGHRNCKTVKGVSFFGPNCEYVVSGSDCGRIFIWKKKGGQLIRVMEADKYVVNSIESHPHTAMLASSGIESDVKVWTPKAICRATLPSNIPKDRDVNIQFGIFRSSRYFSYESSDDDDDGDDNDDDDTDDDTVDEDEDDDDNETDEEEEEKYEEDDSDDFTLFRDTGECDNEDEEGEDGVEADEMEEERDEVEDDSDDSTLFRDTNEHDNETDGSDIFYDDEDEGAWESEEIDDDIDGVDSGD